ncbi:MAG: OmpA family protein [Saprospiraceae bacterium]|nr:OmpA family protein [Saprospiraceae bacterium]
MGIQKRGYKPYHNDFIIPEWNNRTYYTLELLLQPTISFIANIPPAIKTDSTQNIAEKAKSNRSFTHTVFFEFDKHSMEASELSRLDEFAKLMKSKKIQRVEIIGFSDDIGAEAYNLRLSEERAKGIALFLVQNNIVVDQIYMEGKGELEGEQNKELNRKVEVRVMTIE